MTKVADRPARRAGAGRRRHVPSFKTATQRIRVLEHWIDRRAARSGRTHDEERAQIAHATGYASVEDLIDDVIGLDAELPAPVIDLAAERTARASRQAYRQTCTVVALARELADATTGLVFVPSLVRALGAGARAAIVAAAHAGELELRPESGMGRLSPADLALCPPGPHGTRLSWARIVTGKP